MIEWDKGENINTLWREYKKCDAHNRETIIFILSKSKTFKSSILYNQQFNLISKIVLTTYAHESSPPRKKKKYIYIEFWEKRENPWWRHRHSISLGLSLFHLLNNLAHHSFVCMHVYMYICTNTNTHILDVKFSRVFFLGSIFFFSASGCNLTGIFGKTTCQMKFMWCWVLSNIISV